MRGTYKKDSQMKFKNLMLKLSLCDAYILVSGTITDAPQAGDNLNNVDKNVIFKNYAPFTDCISKINNI